MSKETQKDNSKKFKSYQIYSKDNLKFCTYYEENNIIFRIQRIKSFPMENYELKISLNDLQRMEYFDNFKFKNAEKFFNNIIQKNIDSDKYNIKYDNNNDSVIFEIYSEIFENNYAAIKIPHKTIDLKNEIKSLELTITQMNKKLNDIPDCIKKLKDEAAINSFVGTSIISNDEKKLISEWIHPKKILKFVLLYTNAKDSDSSSTFHYFCDGAFPTITVIYDTSGRRFGGYSTQSWAQSPVGGYYSRAVGSFIFNLSNKTKYDLVNPQDGNSIYRQNSYGPTFGGGYDINIANGCKSNTSSYCSKSSYNTGSYNLLGGSSSTSFQVSTYEVYHVINE